MRASEPWRAGVRMVEVESTISILVARASRPRLTDVQTVIFELQILALWRHTSRRDTNIVRTDVSIFPYSELGKNLKLVDHWRSSGRAAETSKHMQAGTEASRYSIGSGLMWTPSRITRPDNEREPKTVLRTDSNGKTSTRCLWQTRTSV